MNHRKQINQSAEDYYEQYDEAMIEDLVTMIEDEFEGNPHLIEYSKNKLDGMTVEEVDEDTFMGIIFGHNLPYTEEARDEWFELWNTWRDGLPEAGQWAGEQAYSDYEDAMEDRYEAMREMD